MSASRSASSSLGLTLFSVAWAVYTLIHLLIDLHRWWQDPLPLALGVVAGAAAVSLLYRPSSLPRLGVLIVAWSAQKLYFLPFLPNHIFLTLCTHLILLLSLGWVFVRSRPSPVRGDTVYATFAPLVRIEILILYFFAVFHKLNSAFFDAAVSCGWALYEEITAIVPLLPTAAPVPALTIYGTIGVEALIPLLLLFRRTRLWGIGLGLVFHLLLALGPRPYVASFSTMLIAVYALFLPSPVRQAILDRVRASRLADGIRALGRGLRRYRWGLLTTAGLGGGLLVLVDLWADAALVRRLALEMRTVGQVLYYGWALAALWFFGRTLWALRPAVVDEPAASRFRPVLTPGVVVLGVVLLNGLSPYVGLKTEMSFSMFSNLRTEAGVSNHLFFPVLHRGNGYQDDLVQVLDGSSAWMTAERRAHERISFFELRRRTSRAPALDTWVQYERNGQVETVRYAQSPNHPLFQALPFWERKLLRFRPVAASDAKPMACGH